MSQLDQNEPKDVEKMELLLLFDEWSKEWKKPKKMYQVFNLDGTLRGESTDKVKIWAIIGTSWAPYEVREKDSGRLVEEFIQF